MSSNIPKNTQTPFIRTRADLPSVRQRQSSLSPVRTRSVHTLPSTIGRSQSADRLSRTTGAAASSTTPRLVTREGRTTLIRQTVTSSPSPQPRASRFISGITARPYTQTGSQGLPSRQIQPSTIDFTRTSTPQAMPQQPATTHMPRSQATAPKSVISSAPLDATDLRAPVPPRKYIAASRFEALLAQSKSPQPSSSHTPPSPSPVTKPKVVMPMPSTSASTSTASPSRGASLIYEHLVKPSAVNTKQVTTSTTSQITREMLKQLDVEILAANDLLNRIRELQRDTVLPDSQWQNRMEDFRSERISQQKRSQHVFDKADRVLLKANREDSERLDSRMNALDKLHSKLKDLLPKLPWKEGKNTHKVDFGETTPAPTPKKGRVHFCETAEVKLYELSEDEKEQKKMTKK